MVDTPIPKGKHCFNCKADDITRPVFCDDCWRMAIITSALGAGSGEIMHRLFGAIFGVG